MAARIARRRGGGTRIGVGRASRDRRPGSTNRLVQVALRLDMRGNMRSVAIAASSVAAATLMAVGIDRALQLPNVSLLFLMAVVLSAISAGYVSALVASILSALAYNYFFIDPLNTFTIASPHEVFAFSIFIGAALVAGGLASRVREQAQAARARAVAVRSLYDFARKLSGTANADNVLWAAVSQLHETFGEGAVVLMPRDGELRLAAAWPPDADLGLADMAAARWAFERANRPGMIRARFRRAAISSGR